MVAQVDEKGRPFLLNVTVEMVPVVQRINVQVNNRTEVREVTKHVPVQVSRRFDLDRGQARLFDATGKALDPKDAAKRLKGPTAVLVSADGKAVDPLYLRLARPETLVVVSSELARALVPPAPPAAVLVPPGVPNIEKK